MLWSIRGVVNCESSISADEPRRERVRARAREKGGGERECCCFTMSVWAERINRYLQCNEIRLKAETTSACDLIW